MLFQISWQSEICKAMSICSKRVRETRSEKWEAAFSSIGDNHCDKKIYVNTRFVVDRWHLCI